MAWVYTRHSASSCSSDCSGRNIKITRPLLRCFPPSRHLAMYPYQCRRQHQYLCQCERQHHDQFQTPLPRKDRKPRKPTSRDLAVSIHMDLILPPLENTCAARRDHLCMKVYMEISTVIHMPITMFVRLTQEMHNKNSPKRTASHCISDSSNSSMRSSLQIPSLRTSASMLFSYKCFQAHSIQGTSVLLV